MQINYLIIDDEPIAHRLIENFASELDYMTLKGNCHSAMEAVPLLKEHDIDLVFLDVNMPKISGFEFLRTLQHPPQVVIISAHKEYALESYEYTITDYLLKPFNFERFFKSLNKVIDNINKQSAQTTNPQQGADSNSANSIFIKDDKKHHKVAIDDLLYIKANGNYSSVYHKQGHILSQMKISDFEKLLPTADFSRVHRSYIVAHHGITLVRANELQLGEVIIPVGRIYKDSVAKLLQT